MKIQLEKKIHARNTKMIENFTDRQDELREKLEGNKERKKGFKYI